MVERLPAEDGRYPAVIIRVLRRSRAACGFTPRRSRSAGVLTGMTGRIRDAFPARRIRVVATYRSEPGVVSIKTSSHC